MPEITLKNITKRWGRFYAVDDVNLKIDDNSFITLLGPSGCGKTTILRMIAGLETPTSGQIKIGDKIVFDSEMGINVPPNKRKVGFLFQNYALWPNMTVYQNISFGLSNVKEEMSKCDFEAIQTSDLIRVLNNPKKTTELIKDCMDKNGKMDKEKACIKLIDSYTISMITAKKAFELNLHQTQDYEKKAEDTKKQLEEKLNQINKSYEAKNQKLNENFEIVENGKVLKEVRKLSKEEIDKAVRQVSRIVKIGMFMDRYPAELSGGQQQRVAIARTLAPKPEVLFMDEPLSNLDAKLRLEMRYELQRLHVETGSTFVYVTHDQMEAMTLATKICLINNGVLQQYDAPLDVYNRPNNIFVADFVGNPSINFIEVKGKMQDGNIILEGLKDLKMKFIPEKEISLEKWFEERDKKQREKEQINAEKLKDKKNVEKTNKDERFKYHIQKVDETDYSIEDEEKITNEDLILAVRPEDLKLDDKEGIKSTIYGAMPTGMESTVKLRYEDYLLTGVVFGGVAFEIGQEIHFTISGKDILLFDRNSGDLISAGKVEII